MKADIELFLSISTEMENIIDRTHFQKHAPYYDPSRKKVVGLYSDEVPLPMLIRNFKCLGPKNNQFAKTNLDKIELEASICVKHKGIPAKVKVEGVDYSKIIVEWDSRYDAHRNYKDYAVDKRLENYEEIRNFAENGKQIERDVFTTQQGKLESSTSRKYESRSFYTTQAGVFLTKVQKRLSVSPSDKVLYTRCNFAAHSFGSRMAKPIYEFNSKKSFNELMSNEHLKKLGEIEKETFERVNRFYPNGMLANSLIKIEERIDYIASVNFLLNQMKKLEESQQRLRKKK